MIGGEPADGDRVTLDGRRALLNPGSVGQPRDGNAAAGWALLDTDSADGHLATDRLRHRRDPAGDDARGPAAAAHRPPLDRRLIEMSAE